LLDKNRPASSSTSISGPLFNGTLHFVQITFKTPNGSFAVSDADVQTLINYSELAVIPISNYASQYGPNSIDVSRDIIRYTVQLDRNEYQPQTCQNGPLQFHLFPYRKTTLVIVTIAWVSTKNSLLIYDNYFVPCEQDIYF
jgi:hypothetical protein